MNPSRLTDEDKEEIDRILESLIEDIQEMRDADWDEGKHALTIEKDANVQPVWQRGEIGRVGVGSVVTSFELGLPDGTWEISHREV